MSAIDDKMIVDQITRACEALPILSRLEFAKNLICNKIGEPGDASFDPLLGTAEELLAGVIRVLMTVRTVAELRFPAP